MMKPSFFIIGVPKAGTTSLHDYLNRHPEIFMSPIKEPHYYDTDIRLEYYDMQEQDFFKRQYEMYKLHGKAHLSFIRNDKEYFSLFNPSTNEKIAGESTPYYFISKVAVDNILADNHNAKIIIMLRNPMERAYSHYKMDLQISKVKETFIEKVRSDYEIYKNFNQQNPYGKKSEIENYIALGMYSDKLKELYTRVKKDNIKVIIFEEFIEDISINLKEIYSFLNVNEYDNLKLESSVSNQSLKHKNYIIKLLMHYYKNTKFNQLSSFIPKNIKSLLQKLLFKKSDLKLSNNEIQYLYEIYHNDIQETETLLGRDLSSWKLLDNAEQ